MNPYRCTIVELCHFEDPRAESLKEVNESLGHRVFRYKGFLVIVLVTDLVWRQGNLRFARVPDGLYYFDEEGKPVKA